MCKYVIFAQRPYQSLYIAVTSETFCTMYVCVCIPFKEDTAEQQAERLPVGYAQTASVLVLWCQQERGEIALSLGTTEHGHREEDSGMEGKTDEDWQSHK